MYLEQMLYLVIAMLFAISAHEFAHGFVAHKLGDPTPQAQGRLTLNPLAHLDPLGALMLIIFRVGWAKPVQINPLYFKDRRKGMMLVAVAGPLTNITLAWLFYLISTVIPYLPFSASVLSSIFVFLSINIQLNLMLAVFNLIPLPPLDGSKILGNLLPLKARLSYERIAPYAPIILIIGLWSGLIHRIIRPVYNVLFSIISGFSL